MCQHHTGNSWIRVLRDQQRCSRQAGRRRKRYFIARRNTPQLSEPPSGHHMSLERSKVINVRFAFVRGYCKAESVADREDVREPEERLKGKRQDFCVKIRAEHQSKINIR